MARRFLVPVELPADATAALHATTKQQLDAGLGGKAAAVHTHAGVDITSGTVGIARIPTGTSAATVALGDHAHTPTAVPVAPRTMSATTTASVDGAVAGDMQITATGNPTITPTGTPNGRMMIVEVLASGAQRTPVMAASVLLGANVTSRSLVVPSGKVGLFGLRYSSLAAGWWLIATDVGA